ncbi:ACT domain-containing protein [Ructibacterium gallinarum]|uniref:aspartate kinase n=1 Tax=Ructibacterium gallinarum TaxID=2779355 RepID=A0A9D5RAQ4_9FIRM|nr:ACT domain-containing protein [Ructibacterium gallinarum]MBE5039313.1 ACT domain-containing protein [Ructibacterium gallinarum]
MIKTVTEIGYLPDVALVTVNNIPNTPQNLASILDEIAARHVTVDMICHTAPYKDKVNLSFTVPQENLAEVISATLAFKALSPEISTDVNGNNTKVILSGAGMRSTYGVAAELFRLLADANISIKLVTTAETEISCLIDIKDIEKVKSLLKETEQ